MPGEGVFSAITTMAHILILVHEHGSFDKPRYFMREIAEVWRERGHRISVMHGPGRRAIAADVAVLHVDLTVVPAHPKTP